MKRQSRLTLLAAAVMALGISQPQAGPDGDRGRMRDPVQPQAESNRPDFVDVIVTFEAIPGQGEIDRIKGLGGETYRSYGRLPMLAIRIPERALEGLAKAKGVEFIALDSPVQNFSQSARKTAKRPAPGAPEDIPVDPTIRVAVLDSGAAQHSDLLVQTRRDCTLPTQVGNDTFRDEFTTASYSNDDGTSAWSSPWQEIGESDGPGTNDVKVTSFPGGTGYGLRLKDDDKGAQRSLDISGASSATLSFSYFREDIEGNEHVALEISSDGGASWTELTRFDGPADDSQAQTFSADITAYASANTVIRFLGSSNFSSGDRVYVDDVQISIPGENTTCPLATTGNAGASDSIFRDEFNARIYNGSDGSGDWSLSAWIEIDEPNGAGPTGGPVQVSPNTTNCLSPNCLRVGGTKPNNPDPGFGVSRGIDLNGASTATMSFSYRRGSFDGGTPTNGTLTLDASSDGGVTWTTLTTYMYDGLDAAQTQQSIDLSNFISAN
ncbi:MAG: hypothetical protein ABFS02_11945, partial [Pseudomonadota bacterium]